MQSLLSTFNSKQKKSPLVKLRYFVIVFVLVGLYWVPGFSGKKTVRMDLFRLLPEDSLDHQPERYQFTVSQGDTLDAIFLQLNIQYTDMLELLQADKAHDNVLNPLVPGYQFDLDILDGRLYRLQYRDQQNAIYDFLRNNPSSDFLLEKRPINSVAYRKIHQNVITSSFYESGLEAGMSDQLIISVARIFEGQVDFIYDIRKGDQFTVLVEDVYLSNGNLIDQRIVYANLKTKGETIEAFRFEDQTGRLVGFFDLDGRPFKSRFIRMPLDFARVSSHFNLKRLHPVKKMVRPHLGTDYAAPTGTPIYATGKGVIQFIGWQNGYGNVVIINHGGYYSTLYAHMSKFRKGMRKGKRVSQKEVIGYVGQTGWATGPHVHYEFRIRGKAKDSVKIRLPISKPLKSSLIPVYKQQRDITQMELNQRLRFEMQLS